VKFLKNLLTDRHTYAIIQTDEGENTVGPTANLPIFKAKIFFKNFQKSVDKPEKVCYDIVTEREGKPFKPERK
jgi:hypothetical protein